MVQVKCLCTTIVPMQRKSQEMMLRLEKCFLPSCLLYMEINILLNTLAAMAVSECYLTETKCDQFWHAIYVQSNTCMWIIFTFIHPALTIHNTAWIYTCVLLPGPSELDNKENTLFYLTTHCISRLNKVFYLLLWKISPGTCIHDSLANLRSWYEVHYHGASYV